MARTFQNPFSAKHLQPLCALGLTLALGLPTLASRADDTPVSRWVSADAVIYAEIPNPALLLDRASDPKVRALFDAVPGLKLALESQKADEFRAVAKLIADEQGKTWEQVLRQIVGGGMVFAVEAPAGKKQEPGAYLVVTPTDPDVLKKTTRSLIELVRKDAESKGMPDPVKSADYRGVTGYQVGPKAAYAIVGGRLVLAERGDTLNAVIDRTLDGPAKAGTIESVDVWRSRKMAVALDDLAWGVARLDRLRELDPKKFGGGDASPDAGATVLFGGWIETFRRAAWVSATLSWTDQKLAANLAMPAPTGERRDVLKGFLPPAGAGAPALLDVPGTILSTSLWRDLSAVWEARASLLRPEDVQNLAKLDTFAGQFFGGRDFGSGVLGSVTPDWHLVVALQDYAVMKPSPDVKLPAVALVADLKPDDDFAQRLKVAFQSFVGLANLGAAQTKAPPLEMLSETCEGVTLSTTRFMDPTPIENKAKGPGESTAVHYRHNYSPSSAQVGDHFVISSSVGLARELIKSYKKSATPAKPEDGTLVAVADGPALAKLVAMNRDQLVMRNILKKGNDQTRAEGEVDLLATLLRYLGKGRLAVSDGSDLWRLSLRFDLGK